MRYEKEELVQVINAILAISEASKIKSTFLAPFHRVSSKRLGLDFLHGNYNLGGTVSGRLSSSSPNLQNLPSTGTKYAKSYKACISTGSNTTPDWLFVGADYSALEDRVGALLANDPEKLKIFTEGYDGHCQKAYVYYKEQMPDINPKDVKSINSIKHKYPKLRQSSKTISFAIQYGATANGLIHATDLDYASAEKMVERYHKLFKVSDTYTHLRLQEASNKGYTELAFGLRLRTPILEKTVMGSTSIPKEAHKEIKSVANALVQSYGLLNSVAANRFMEKVWNSKYAHWILPAGQIHDSQYYIVRNDMDCILWVNNNLIDCMVKFDELHEIFSEQVKLQSSLEIYWPDWAHSISIPNYANRETLLKTIQEKVNAVSE
jgi:DNA polymerase-1